MFVLRRVMNNDDSYCRQEKGGRDFAGSGVHRGHTPMFTKEDGDEGHAIDCDGGLAALVAFHGSILHGQLAGAAPQCKHSVSFQPCPCESIRKRRVLNTTTTSPEILLATYSKCSASAISKLTVKITQTTNGSITAAPQTVKQM